MKALKVFGFIGLSVLVTVLVSFVEVLYSGFFAVLSAKVFHYSLMAPSMAKTIIGGSTVLLIAPLLEEGAKALFLRKGPNASYFFAAIFAAIEGVCYVSLILSAGYSLIFAISLRTVAFAMHIATVLFQINAPTRLLGWRRGFYAHAGFNCVSSLMFWWMF